MTSTSDAEEKHGGSSEKALVLSKAVDAQCYCGKPRNLNLIELLCVGCLKWFHESCISYQMAKLVPFMLNYVFTCKNCSQTGIEQFRKTQAQFSHICVTALANLQHDSQREGNPRVTFSKARELIPFIESHWESITTLSRRTTATWHQSIQRALMKDVGSVFLNHDRPKENEPETELLPELAQLGPVYPMFGLKNTDLTHIRPSYESHSTGGKGRGSKRKNLHEGGGAGGGKKSKGGDGGGSRLAAHGYPIDHPFNKDVFRYILTEPDPHAPFRQEFDECQDSAGKVIPSWLYRAVTSPVVLLAMHDRAPQLKIGDHRASVTGEKGYCMVRATHGVAFGTWYWECTVVEMPEHGAARVGWGLTHANLQAPLGYDKFGYSYRSKKGTKFNESNGRQYGESFGKGDTIGFLIELPESKPLSAYLPPSYKDRPLVKFKNHLYFEEKDDLKAITKALTPLPGSKITFFKNGVSQGVAYEDIHAGAYYPGVSVFKSTSVTINFGPNFKHPPANCTFKPMCVRAEEAIIEQAMADMLYLTENHGKLTLDMF